MKKIVTLCIFAVSICKGFSTLPGSPLTAEERYIKKYVSLAKLEELRTGVPVCITLAQGMLESQCGKSYLADNAHNHFGIKYGSGWKDGFVYHNDEHKNEKFRKYKSVEESFDDHSNILKSRSRYASLFKLNPADYRAWAHGLQNAGYATNKHYAISLIHLIEKYQLEQYSLTSDDMAQMFTF